MAAAVFTNVIGRELQETLEDVATTEKKSGMGSLVLKKWCDVDSMKSAFIDFSEFYGPGLASEKTEGAEIAVGGAGEGVFTRIFARTFALKMIISQEAMEDNKYPEAVNLARELSRSMFKTADYDATSILIRGFNTSYVGGDGQPLFSASHTIPAGGTYSNLMATPQSPSIAALLTARAQILNFPALDNLLGDVVQMKKIICTVNQTPVWQEVTESSKRPEVGQYNAINVVNKWGLDIVENVFWTNTTTNYAIKTDADGGPTFYWRVKPETNTWKDNDNTVMKHSIRARWGRGWREGRAIYGVNL